MPASTSIDALLETAIALQQIPAPTFDEAARADAVAQFWQRLGLEVQRDEVGNVYTRLNGSAPTAQPVVLSAHLDTVFPKDTPLDVNRTSRRVNAPGLGDNALALAALIEVARRYQEGNLDIQGDLHLVANVGEEGLGNLVGMRAVVARFGAAPRAYVILEGLALGVIYHRGLGVQRYKITVQAQGGHSWADYGRPSAIHALAHLITQLDALPVPQTPRTSLNVGVIQGGTSINTIAPQAWLELDLRSESQEVLARLSGQVQHLVSQTNRKRGVEAVIENLGERPSGEIPADHPLVNLAAACLQAHHIPARRIIGSTDANVPLSLGHPAITIGLTHGGNAHTRQEYIELAPLKIGMSSLFMLLERIWQD
ncbi:MAG: M20/M25/M40 family metallo-hydrolase [Anaerolineales bacterium]